MNKQTSRRQFIDRSCRIVGFTVVGELLGCSRKEPRGTSFSRSIPQNAPPAIYAAPPVF